MVLIFAGATVYWVSWGHVEKLPEDPKTMETQEQEKLQGELAPLEKTGIIDERLYQAQTNLGNHYWYYKRFQNGETQFKNRIDTASTLYGEASPQAYQCTFDLAGLYRDWVKFKECEQLYKRLLAIDQNREAPTSNKITRDINNLAVLYCLWGQSLTNISKRMQKFKQAESLYTQCLSRLKDDQSNQLYKIILRNRAVTLKEMGRVTEAESDEHRAENASK